MENKNSEIGAAEDLIRSIVQMSCAEIHAMGLYFKAVAEMENGLIKVEDPDVLQKQIEKTEMLIDDIKNYATLRRQMMNVLQRTFDGDKTMWCMIKHLGLSAMQVFEAYENSDNDVELLQLAYEANKAFVKAMTRFLGVEITDCAACFSDMMKGASE